ncbi:sugar ABC transporter ATP-binding protein [Bacillus sp. BRMEA1]|uniref:sugar ABC transporter ATP-binding protein n=1 Tax=Neobacillus endophyticus TaxID=2738405 RepID=UPI0015638541|nr:sugar ABC transporter ATP-binding protein [Neobacillus endophyticus]NRD78019.1 sugar ABC transporter ATP-binding protein [Neobacillus endophyticus]
MCATLDMKNISIEFPGVKALDQVNFSMKTGTVHALIGANGAGKSTLMKILSGAYDHYNGEIWFDEEIQNIRTPKNAQDAGIQIVYQEVDTAIIPYLTVAENIMLLDAVHHMGKKQWINWKRIHEKAAAILKDMKIDLPVKKLASELTLAEKQMILIARAISNQCKFLILDEPTAPLSHTETGELFRIVRNLKQNNVGIIFIFHRLPEIFEICDVITVMRNGEVAAKAAVSETSPSKVVEQMLGQKLEEQFPEKNAVIGDTVLEVKGLTDSNKIRDLHIHVRAGEIVGIAGLVGAGKTELCKALFGAAVRVSGEVVLYGRRLKLKNPFMAVQNGIALVPEERRKEGILVHESVQANLTAANLKSFSKVFSFVDRKKEKAAAKQLIKSLGIKTPSEDAIVQNLSGGNQQKVSIGKWLIAEADVYIFDEPTKGVDVGAKKDIFELIVELARRGKAIIYASSELSEIIGITDRVYVLYDGRNVKELETSGTNEEELLFYSTGGR